MAELPSVCAIMLTANRPELARRAVECFRKQTYPNKRLLIWDTGTETDHSLTGTTGRISHAHAQEWRGQTIGELRNAACKYFDVNKITPPEIMVHFDDDDYSHPNRISEQVALLQSSGADVVGYNEMLFWREPHSELNVLENNPYKFEQFFAGEAWLYQNADTKYALGTSLCYWRRTWERKPFDATSSGEDERFIRGLKAESVTSVFDTSGPPPDGCGIAGAWARGAAPRMIARIHGSNTSGAYKRESMEREARRVKNPMWKRTPEWDKFCNSIMR